MKKAVQILLLSAFLLTFTVTKQVNAMQNTQEIWKDINGYEGLYKISSYGSIKNKDDKVKAQHLRKEYFSVILYNKTIWKTYSIHRLVALTFIPNPDNLPQVNHIDGNKINNHYSNLEWCTPQYNTIHAINNNLRHPAVGEKYNRSILTDEKVRQIRIMATHMTHRDIADQFGLCQPTITKIVNRRYWKHVI